MPGFRRANRRQRPLFQWRLSPPLSHCKQDPIYVFPEMKLRILVPNFYICVSVTDLNIPTIGTPFFLQQNSRTDRVNLLSLTDT
jgi:hypothetical protein